MKIQSILVGLALLALAVGLLRWVAVTELSEPVVAGAPIEAELERLTAFEPITVEESSSAVVSNVQRSVEGARQAAKSLSDVGGDTILSVLVIAKETGRPIVGARVLLGGEDPDGFIFAGLNHDENDPAGGYLSTDEKGAVRFQVQPGDDYFSWAEDADGTTSSPYRDIPPLLEHEQRQVVFELRTIPDLQFYGQLVTEEGAAPPASIVTLSDGQSIEVDPDGRFSLMVKSWVIDYGLAKAPGFSESFFEITPEYAFPEQVRTITLHHSATLQVRILDSGSEPVRVVCTAKSYQLVDTESMFGMFFPPDPKWSASTDADGSCEFLDMPAGATISISLSGQGRHKSFPEFVHLQPSETRRIELGFSVGATIQGLAVYSDGGPARSQEIWLVSGRTSGRIYLDESAKPSGQTITDKHGRFEFKAVESGTWYVGPAALRGHFDEAQEGLIAPVASVVEVAPSDTLCEVRLTLHVGLYIRGAVVDPDGDPMSDAVYIHGFSDECGFLFVRSADDGRFALGPLPPGSYTLSSRSFMTGFVGSEKKTVEAGAKNVVLQLRLGAALRGKVIDGESGSPAKADLVLSWPATSDDPFPFLMTSTENGDFEFPGHEANNYTVFASDGVGKTGLLQVALADQVDSEDLVVNLEAGGWVELIYSGEDRYGQFQLWSGGTVIGADGILSGTKRKFQAPEGRIRVTQQSSSGELEQFVDVKAGEVTQVKFTKR